MMIHMDTKYNKDKLTRLTEKGVESTNRRDKDRDMDRDRGYVDDECVVTWKGGGGPNTLTGNSPSDLPLRRVEEVTRGGRRRLAFVRVLSCFKSNCPQLN